MTRSRRDEEALARLGLVAAPRIASAHRPPSHPNRSMSSSHASPPAMRAVWAALVAANAACLPKEKGDGKRDGHMGAGIIPHVPPSPHPGPLSPVDPFPSPPSPIVRSAGREWIEAWNGGHGGVGRPAWSRPLSSPLSFSLARLFLAHAHTLSSTTHPPPAKEAPSLLRHPPTHTYQAPPPPPNPGRGGVGGLERPPAEALGRKGGEGGT